MSSNAEISTTKSNETEDLTEEVNREQRQGLLKVLANAIGLDITVITLPVTINEPASFLMRMCEQVQYCELLDQGAMFEDSVERMMYVAIFAASLYACAERTGKPFNPLLGETFEMVEEEKNNFRFIAEQVSHHPPIGACHAETDHWVFWQSQQLKTKFTGNALDCKSIGSSNVYFKEHQEHYKWHQVLTTVHNVILGKAWLDHYGDMEIVNKKTGDVARLNFVKCGWFSRGWHEISGTIYNAEGMPCIQLFGKWNEAIYAKPVETYAPTLNSLLSESPRSRSSSESNSDKSEKENKKLAKELMKEQKREEKEFQKQLKDLKRMVKKKLTLDEPIWVHKYQPVDPSKLESPYEADWTERSFQLVELDEEMKKILPRTDSRLRTDRYALQKNDKKTAAAEKHRLEEKQRAERRERGKRAWIPRYFKLEKDDDGEEYWKFLGTYWDERKKRIDEKNSTQ